MPSAETKDIAASVVRQKLRERFGSGRYRITRDGEIHAYGQMPNSNLTGWWLFGYLSDEETMHRLGIEV
jgi:hypothetical protein